MLFSTRTAEGKVTSNHLNGSDNTVLVLLHPRGVEQMMTESQKTRMMRSWTEVQLKSLGKLVLIVGPSGAGKDSILERVQSNLVEQGRQGEVEFVRRYITRPHTFSADGEMGAKDHLISADAATNLSGEERKLQNRSENLENNGNERNTELQTNTFTEMKEGNCIESEREKCSHALSVAGKNTNHFTDCTCNGSNLVSKIGGSSSGESLRMGGHIYVTEEQFSKLRDNNTFLLWWKAHGWNYALPLSLLQNLRSGRHCVANVSRTVVEEARKKYPHVKVVLITADEDNIRKRMIGRKRETEHQIQGRLERERQLFEGKEINHDVIIFNDSEVELARGVETMLDIFKTNKPL